MGLFNFWKKKDTPAPTPESPKPVPSANPGDGLTPEEQFEKGVTAYNSGDYETALSLLEILAQKGHVTAQFNCGVMYYNGEGTAIDKAKAKLWLQKPPRRDMRKQKNFYGNTSDPQEGHFGHFIQKQKI